MRVLGAWILGAAALMGIYALFFLDTSIATGFGRVHNLGLMADRQNLLIAACACAVVGAIFAVAGQQSTTGDKHKSFQVSPFEADMVRALARDDAAAVKHLLESNRMDATDELESGRGLLQHAVTVHAFHSMRVLRQAGATSKRRDKAGNTALEMAIGDLTNPAALVAALREPV